LQSLPGVANVKIDAGKKSATVSGDAQAFVLEDAISALEKCGFPAETSESLQGS